MPVTSGPTLTAGPIFWAADDTAAVLRFYRDFAVGAPDELGNVIRLGTIPPLPGISKELRYRPAIAVASCYAGPVEDAERAVRALREFGTPLVDLVGPTIYVDHQSSIDDTVPHGCGGPPWSAAAVVALGRERSGCPVSVASGRCHGAGRADRDGGAWRSQGRLALWPAAPSVGD